jgi:hypothetical protein
MPYKLIAIAILALMLSSSIESQQSSVPSKKDEALICVKWRWAYTAFEGKSICVEWIKKDCSNRLYTELCKKGG